MIQPETFSPAKRRPKPAQPLTPAQQQRLRLRQARLIVQNAADAPSRQVANRLVTSWRVDDMLTQALADMAGNNAKLKWEAQEFLAVVAPDRLPKPEKT